MRDPSLPDPRNIGIGPAGRAFMGALLRLGDALATQPPRDTDGSPQGPDRNGLDGEAATAGAEGIAQPPYPKGQPK